MNRATVGLSERLEHHSVTQVYTPISKIKLIRCETCTEIGEQGALELLYLKKIIHVRHDMLQEM